MFWKLYSSIGCSFCSLYIQIYLLNACKLDCEENLLNSYLTPRFQILCWMCGWVCMQAIACLSRKALTGHWLPRFSGKHTVNFHTISSQGQIQGLCGQSWQHSFKKKKLYHTAITSTERLIQYVMKLRWFSASLDSRLAVSKINSTKFWQNNFLSSKALFNEFHSKDSY